MTTYEDFDDLRDNCPAAYRAEIAIDLMHTDPEKLAAIWAATSDGEFRLALTGAAADFWEKEVRARGGDIPVDHFAMEIVVDSYADQDMGHSLYLEGNAYCGSDEVGDICWTVLEDDVLERAFADAMATQVGEILGRFADIEGLACQVEVTEIEEL